MEQILLLVKAITLLYHESKLEGLQASSSPLVQSVLTSVKPPENTLEYDVTRDVVIGLIGTTNMLLDQPLGTEVGKDSLLQRVKVIAGQEASYVYDALKTSIELDLTDTERRTERLTIIGELTNYKNQQSIKEMVREYSKKLLYTQDSTVFRDVFEEFRNKAAIAETTRSGTSVMDTLDVVSLDDKDKMTDCFDKGIELTSSKGIMRLGLQGLNEMLGEEAGLRRGNMYMIGALSHNGKSLSLKSWPIQVARYNKPYLIDETKKPLILYISFEDNNEKSLQEMYKYLYENKHKVAISAKDRMESGELTTEEAIEFVRSEMEVNGFKFEFIKAVGNNFTYLDLYEVIAYYEGMGYEICLMSLDYIDMMSRAGCAGDRDEQKTTMLIRNIRQHCENKGITVISAHQLSDKANELARDGEENLARSCAERGMWKGCRTLHTEIDVEIVQHIVRPGDGYSYMTYMRGKHRGLVNATDEVKKFVVYRFQPYGGLGEDIDGPSQARRTVAGRTDGGSGDDGAFWEETA